MLGKLSPLHLLIICLLLLSSNGCERKIEQVTDDDLRAKYAECFDMNEPAAAMILACENYKRECDRRSKKIGRFIC